MNFKVSQANGTAVDLSAMAEKMQVVQGLPLDVLKTLASGLLSAESVSWFEFSVRDSLPVQEIRETEAARSALSAATDALRHNRYTAPVAGLHLYTSELNSASGYTENAGVVLSNFQGLPEMGIPPFAALAKGKEVHGLQLGHSMLGWNGSHLGNEEKAALRLRHHLFVEMLTTHTLKVWVAPIRAYAGAFLLQMLEQDDTKAWQLRLDLIGAAQTRSQIVRPLLVEAWKQAQEAKAAGTEPAESTEAPQERTLLIAQIGKSRSLNLYTVEAGTVLRVHDGRQRFVSNVVWLPEDPASVGFFERAAEKGLSVRK